MYILIYRFNKKGVISCKQLFKNGEIVRGSEYRSLFGSGWLTENDRVELERVDDSIVIKKDDLSKKVTLEDIFSGYTGNYDAEEFAEEILMARRCGDMFYIPNKVILYFLILIPKRDMIRQVKDPE